MNCEIISISNSLPHNPPNGPCWIYLPGSYPIHASWCVAIWWGMNSLPVARSQRRMILPPSLRSYQLPIAPQIGRESLGLSPVHAVLLTGLILCSSFFFCSGQHSCYESVHYKSDLSRSQHFTAFCPILQFLHSSCSFPEGWALRVIYPMYYDLLWVPLLTTAHCRKLRAALLYGYECKHLECSLTAWPLNDITTVGTP